MRKTKIVATIGPSSDSEEMLEKLIKAGLNVARFNMSHGTHETHLEKINKIKALNKKLGTNVGLMLDTKGPEIRLGDFDGDKALLIQGTEFILTTEDILGTDERVSVTYKGITKDVELGTTILLDDGLIELKVEKVKKNQVVCRVMNTGVIKSKKGVNIPGIKLSLPALTERDKEDIKFGIENDIDFVAASFVRKTDDVIELRKYMNSLDGETVKIIAKIENQEGIDNFDEILSVVDGIMVARGDMGVEVSIERLPAIQKMMIKKAIASGKMVITATQMLESMITNPRPTRAEVSDVANAIYDGTGAIMLSGESASGKYPEECIKMMNDIALATENNIDYWNRFKKRNVDKMGAYIGQQVENKEDNNTFRRQINFAVCSSALFTEAKAIISISDKGKTPAVLSGYRPECPIYVFTANEKTYKALSLEWGVKAFYFPNVYNFEEILKKGVDTLINDGLLKKGDIAILGGGTSSDHVSENYLSTQAMGAVIRI